MESTVFVPVALFIDDKGNVREQRLWTMASELPGMTRTQAENYFGQYADVWAETYADLGYEMVSLRVAEFREV